MTVTFRPTHPKLVSLKPSRGRFLEDFLQGQRIHHATPRTVTEADATLNVALTGSRFALFSSDLFAQRCGLPRAPIDPLLAFHIVFGKTVPDVSLNAVANLGYAQGVFQKLVYAGSTLTAVSDVLGLKENSSKASGVVWIRTQGVDEQGEPVLEYVRWVMVQKAFGESLIPAAPPPVLENVISAQDLQIPDFLTFDDYAYDLAGEPYALEDYEIGERLDHIDGMCVEEAEHQIATRLYQNTAKVHFNEYAQRKGLQGRRLIYGGVAISIARAISFNGLANAQLLLAVNAGTHVNPLFAGDTVFAWSQVLDKALIAPGIGALRIRLIATKNKPCTQFPGADPAVVDPDVILDFDYWAAIPSRLKSF